MRISNIHLKVQHRVLPGDLPHAHAGDDGVLPADGDQPLEGRRQHRHKQHHCTPSHDQESTEQEKGRPDVKLSKDERDSKTSLTHY